MALFDFLFGKDPNKDPEKVASPDAIELGKKLRTQLLETAILPEVRIYFSEFPALKSACFWLPNIGVMKHKMPFTHQ